MSTGKEDAVLSRIGLRLRLLSQSLGHFPHLVLEERLPAEMAFTVEIPPSLVKELWAWYNPQDKYAPTSYKEAAQMGICHDMKTYVIMQVPGHTPHSWLLQLLSIRGRIPRKFSVDSGAQESSDDGAISGELH